MGSAINLRLRRGLDPEVLTLSFERRVLHLRRSLAPHAGAIVAALADLREARGGLGNRQSAFKLSVPGAPEMVARAARRGGVMRLLTSDLHVGVMPRPVRELKVSLEARRRGIPLAEPMGAMVEWAAPLVYRGFFLTRALPGMTLWELVRTDDDPRVRIHVLEQARAAIEAMHQGGLFHADLNLHNLYVTKAGDSFAVVILDLDKARLFRAPIPAELRRRNARRLLRSARKLDSTGRYFDSQALAILKVA